MELEGSMPHSQELFNEPIVSRINPIPRIDTYLFKIILMLYSHLCLGLSRSTCLLPLGLPVKF